MTARSIRRAQERKGKKLERKAANQQANELNLDAPISAAKLAANQANSQLSTGPRSAEGKAKSSLNAVKSALTGRTVLLPTDDAAEYENHLLAYEKELRPSSQQECSLVQSLADIAWRLNRIPALELAIYAKGRIQFANLFDDQEASSRPGLIELHTFITYEKQLRNLHLQESRLARRQEKEYAAFRLLQQERTQKEKFELDLAAKHYLAAQHDHKPFDPADHGFDFPIEDVEAYLEGARIADVAHATLNNKRAEAQNAA